MKEINIIITELKMVTKIFETLTEKCHFFLKVFSNQVNVFILSENCLKRCEHTLTDSMAIFKYLYIYIYIYIYIYLKPNKTISPNISQKL